MTGFVKVAYLSLGSNLGDRAAQIDRAIAALEAAGVRVKRRSLLYETEPVGVATRNWFLNCVIEIETELLPLRLLHLTQRIERELGRRPHFSPAPVNRPIDIDILLFGNSRIETAELTLPHPRLAERRFVLAPLCELAPDLRHTLTRKTAAEMLAELAGGGGAARPWRSEKTGAQ
jgi:2-amino-4-hydroxy-6-hydroxymethyldihydropteridine diphosphokinase